jgi:hypothetical protein
MSIGPNLTIEAESTPTPCGGYAFFLSWLYQSRLTRFEVHGVSAENLLKTAYFDILREVKAKNS